MGNVKRTKGTSDRAGKGLVTALLIAAVLWCMPSAGQAAIVTQLEITGGSISLNFGSLGNLTGSFSANGQFVMGQYQPTPDILDPVTISHLTFSIYSSSGGALNLPAPTAQTSGATMTGNFQSLFAGLTSTGWAGLLTGPSNPPTVPLNIGGVATGSFNEATNAFDVSWTRSLTGIPSLSSGTFSLQGTAQLAAVPVPAAVWLFGSGMIGLVSLARRRNTPDASRRDVP